MPYYVRKVINKETLCSLKDIQKSDDFSADLITSEFRTKQNSLSFWQIQTIKDINEALVIIALTSTSVDKIDLIVIDKNHFLVDESLTIQETYAGIELPLKEPKSSHFDVINLDIKRLGNLAFVYKKAVEETEENFNKLCFHYSREEVKKLLVEENEGGRLIIDIINKKIKDVILAS